MEPAWRSENETVSSQFIIKMAKEARLSNLWINVGREWYTPDEFHALASKPHRVIEKQVKLKDPIEALNRMRFELDKMEHKLSEFAIRVATYYRDKK